MKFDTELGLLSVEGNAETAQERLITLLKSRLVENVLSKRRVETFS